MNPLVDRQPHSNVHFHTKISTNKEQNKEQSKEQNKKEVSIRKNKIRELKCAHRKMKHLLSEQSLQGN